MSFTDLFFIFGARYLYLASGAIAVAIFFFLPRQQQKQMVILAGIALPLAYLITLIAAHFYYDPRPFVVGGFTPLVPHVPDNGFPSDHVLLTSSIAALYYPFRRKWSYGLAAITTIVAISRVYVGIHHITDVIGSVVIVIISVCVASWFLKWLRSKYNFAWMQ